jgi:hypothetical protein
MIMVYVRLWIQYKQASLCRDLCVEWKDILDEHAHEACEKAKEGYGEDRDQKLVVHCPTYSSVS